MSDGIAFTNVITGVTIGLPPAPIVNFTIWALEGSTTLSTILPSFIVTTQTVLLLAGYRTNGVKSDEFCEMPNEATQGLVDEGPRRTLDAMGPAALIL